jgi:aspartate racemase
MSRRAIGVIGGMGPAATLAFIARVQALTPATRDQEHLRLIVDCNPAVPDRNAAVAGQGPSPGPVLADMARGLQRAGAEVLVMPCNAAHAFRQAITDATPLPFIDLIETACDATAALAPPFVGLLAADGCLAAGLYQSAFAQRGIATRTLTPTRQAAFMDLLYRIKAGDAGEDVRRAMIALAQTLIDEGADVLVAGCTEVPLVLAEGDLERPLVDSLEALARRTVALGTGAHQL